MGLFKDQVLRLLREDWDSPKELAEELYAILNADIPLTLDGPITINNNSSEPAVTIQQSGPSDSAIQIVKSPLPGFDPGNPPDFGLGGLGNETLTLVGNDGLISTGTGDAAQPNNITLSAQGGGGIPARVVSFVTGSTANYVMRAFPNGLTAASVLVVATQLQIADGEVLSAGTWTILTKLGSKYFMQVPVWQE